MNTEKSIIRSKELANRLGISPTTLWRWRRERLIIQPMTLGPKMVGWRVEDIEAWLSDRQKQGGL